MKKKPQASAARARRKEITKPTVADLRKAREIQLKDPAMFKSSPRLQAIIADWSKPDVASGVIEAVQLSDKYLSLIPEMEEALKIRTPGARDHMENAPAGIAMETLLPHRFRPKKKPGPQKGKLEPQTVEVIRRAAQFLAAGKIQTQMAPELFPDSLDQQADTRRLFFRHRALIEAELRKITSQ